MKKLLLLVLAGCTYPPLSAGGEPKNDPAVLVRQCAVINLIGEIDATTKKVVKKADIKELLEHGYVTTTINGKQTMCHVCGEAASYFWIDCEAGCSWSRCEKHRYSK